MCLVRTLTLGEWTNYSLCVRLGESIFLSATVLGLNAELGRGISHETRARVNWCPDLEGGLAYMLH